VVPAIAVNPDRREVPALVLTNTGTMRFDIFKGAFTTDTTFIISPFVSKFLFIKDVPYKSARQILKLLNTGGPVFSTADLKTSQLAPPEQQSIHADIIAPLLPSIPSAFDPTSPQHPLLSSQKEPDLVPGYTTKDAAGTDGDDTLHAPISFYQVPNVIQTPISLPSDKEPETVDLVFIDFLKPWVLAGLEFTGAKYNTSDIGVYRNETLTELMAGWIKENWGHDC
jgi:hypothetical protein